MKWNPITPNAGDGQPIQLYPDGTCTIDGYQITQQVPVNNMDWNGVRVDKAFGEGGELMIHTSPPMVFKYERGQWYQRSMSMEKREPINYEGSGDTITRGGLRNPMILGGLIGGGIGAVCWATIAIYEVLTNKIQGVTDAGYIGGMMYFFVCLILGVMIVSEIKSYIAFTRGEDEERRGLLVSRFPIVKTLWVKVLIIALAPFISLLIAAVAWGFFRLVGSISDVPYRNPIPDEIGWHRLTLFGYLINRLTVLVYFVSTLYLVLKASRLGRGGRT